MTISSAFLTTCRAAIILTPEYTAYRAAVDALDAANDVDRLAKWGLAYGDAQAGMSPAYRLRRAIRDVIAAQDLSGLSRLEREQAYQTLVGLYLRDDERPQTPEEEAAALTELINQGATDG